MDSPLVCRKYGDAMPEETAEFFVYLILCKTCGIAGQWAV
jgi:hypothetical protein